MDKNTAIEVVRFFGERLTARAVRVSKFVLFGSYSRDDATEDSDVDVVTISEDFRGKDIFARAAMVGKAEGETIKRFMVPLDVIMMTPEEYENGSSLIAQAARNGTVLTLD